MAFSNLCRIYICISLSLLEAGVTWGCSASTLKMCTLKIIWVLLPHMDHITKLYVNSSRTTSMHKSSIVVCFNSKVSKILNQANDSWWFPAEPNNLYRLGLTSVAFQPIIMFLRTTTAKPSSFQQERKVKSWDIKPYQRNIYWYILD